MSWTNIKICMKRNACHQNPFQFSFTNFPKKHFFNIPFANVHLCCFSIFPFIHNIVLNSIIICPLLCIRRFYHSNLHRKTKCKNLQSRMYLCHPNSKNQNYVMGYPPLYQKRKMLTTWIVQISNKYLQFLMGVLVQVEKGWQIALEIGIPWPMKRLKGWLVFSFWVLGVKEGSNDQSTLEVQMI